MLAVTVYGWSLVPMNLGWPLRAAGSDVVAQLFGASRRATALTPREREVLALMAEGRSNKAICAKLFLSPKTVEAHVKHIFMKLGIDQSADDHRRVLAVLASLRSTD